MDHISASNEDRNKQYSQVFTHLAYKILYGGKVKSSDFMPALTNSHSLAELVINTEYALSYSTRPEERVLVVYQARKYAEILLLNFVGEEDNIDTMIRYDRFIENLSTIDIDQDYFPGRSVLALLQNPRNDLEIISEHIQSEHFDFPEDF